jgi:hypothetical protein
MGNGLHFRVQYVGVSHFPFPESRRARAAQGFEIADLFRTYKMQYLMLMLLSQRGHTL